MRRRPGLSRRDRAADAAALVAWAAELEPILDSLVPAAPPSALSVLADWHRSNPEHHVRRMARVGDRYEIELARGAEVIGTSVTQPSFEMAVRTAVCDARCNAGATA